MRALSELISERESAWPEVQRSIAAAAPRAEILPVARADGERTLHALQVTTRSPMGALALETGGLFLDHGWLRILGGGCARMTATLATWNGLDGNPPSQAPPFLVVAYDVVGGFFAINGGGLSGKPGDIFHFAPDTLEWESLGRGYSAFLAWALQGDLAKFYENARWDGWPGEIAPLSGDDGILIYPPLWTRESKTGTPHRGRVPMKELWAMQMDVRRQLRRG